MLHIAVRRELESLLLVDYLSRARTPKQVREILENLAAGKIDIIAPAGGVNKG